MLNWMSCCSIARFLKRLAICVALLATVNAYSIERYVCVSNATPVAPYTNWTTAATTIQAAVDAASAGDTVWVTNGVYDSGAAVAPGHVGSNRVVIVKDVTVQSVNGPAMTFINGSGTNLYGTVAAVRCVYMSAGELRGFTLRGGATRFSDSVDGYGGGILFGADTASASNCVIDNCRAIFGGGVYGGTLKNCVISRNTAAGGQSPYGGGGGANGGKLINCILTGNSSASFGGGASCSALVQCIVSGNVSASSGGGTYMCVGVNCVLTDNSIGAMLMGSIGGGAYSGAMTNCIVYGNRRATAVNNTGGATIMDHCCTDPASTNGLGNIVALPLFVGTNDFHLLPGSLCINAGTNLTWTGGNTDMDGKSRVLGGIVDIGVYESDRGGETLSDALDSPSLTWTTGDLAVWFPQFAESSDGSDAAQGGPIPDNSQTWLQAEVSTAGTLSFMWKVSCQPQYDSLAFYVDGEPHELISGETEWQQCSVFMGPGPHTNLWVYAKGKSGAAGADCGWVDQVTWTSGVPGALWTLSTVSANGYGGPTPALGEQLFTNNAMVSASVISPWVLVPENEARACSGWTRTNILPLSGTGTNTVFRMTWDATLTWLWRTQYWLKAETLGAGTIDQVSAWCDLGTNMTVTATPDSGWRFDHWSGDLAGATFISNRITVVMNSMRHVTAHFVILDLAEALDTTNLLWTTGGDAPWGGQTAVTWDGIDAARSGVIGDFGMTWMETQVAGPGTLAFQWRCSSEIQYDFAYFLVDGFVRSWLTGTNNTGWNAVSVNIAEGAHSLRWEYWKDESNATGADACWVDSFVWTPALIHGFDVWSGLHGLTGERSFLFAHDRDSDGVANGIEYALGTNWSPGQVLMNIKLIGDVPVVEIPKQEISTGSYAEILLRGCTNLPSTSGSWTLPILPATNTIGKPVNRDWFVPEGRPPKAFFRIEAVLRE